MWRGTPSLHSPLYPVTARSRHRRIPSPPHPVTAPSSHHLTTGRTAFTASDGDRPAQCGDSGPPSTNGTRRSSQVVVHWAIGVVKRSTPCGDRTRPSTFSRPLPHGKRRPSVPRAAHSSSSAVGRVTVTPSRAEMCSHSDNASSYVRASGGSGVSARRAARLGSDGVLRGKGPRPSCSAAVAERGRRAMKNPPSGVYSRTHGGVTGGSHCRWSPP